MLRIAALLVLAIGCRVSGDTDQSTTLSTSDYPPGKGTLLNARELATRAPAPQPLPKGTSDTSTNSGTYNTGRSTTRTVARPWPATY